MKIPAAKAAVDKEWEKLEKISAWNLTKVRSKKEVIDEARMSGPTVHFASLMDTCHLKNAELEAKHQKYEGRLVLRGGIYRTRIISITNGSSQDHGYHIQIAWLRKTSSWRSICLYPSQNGRCSKITKNSKFGMSRHLDSSTTTQMAQIMVQYGRSSCSSWAKSVRSSFWQDCYGKSNLRKSYWSTVERKFPIVHAYSYTVKKRVILICVCGWHQIGWKETKYWSDVETTQQRSWFGRTNIFPWSCVLGMHSTTMQNKQRYCGQLQNHVRVANFRGKSREITIPSTSSNLFMVLWHGGSCKEMCGTILWVGEQDDPTTPQVSTPCIDDHFKEEELKSVGELSKKYALKLFWNAFTWHELVDLIFYGQWTNLRDRLQKGPKLVTNDYLVWSPTFITQVNTNNIIMWEILLSNAGWDCFKIPTLQEILRTQNPLLEEHCALLDVIHLFQ